MHKICKYESEVGLSRCVIPNDFEIQNAGIRNKEQNKDFRVKLKLNTPIVAGIGFVLIRNKNIGIFIVKETGKGRLKKDDSVT